MTGETLTREFVQSFVDDESNDNVGSFLGRLWDERKLLLVEDIPLPAALDTVIAEVENGPEYIWYEVSRNNYNISHKMHLLAMLRALRAETSAPDAHTRAEAESGATGDSNG